MTPIRKILERRIFDFDFTRYLSCLSNVHCRFHWVKELLSTFLRILGDQFEFACVVFIGLACTRVNVVFID